MKKCIVIILLLISSVLLTINLSKEETSIEVNKVSKIDKVLEKPAGIQAFTLNGEETTLSYSELITNNTVNKITCKNGTTATYNFMDNTVTLSNVKMPDYCVMDFKQGKILYNVILSDNSTKSTRSDFSSVFTSTTTGTLYKATEKNVHNTSDTTVYYYAGNTTNNWVYFAGYYWRIIRTNADGSVRLLYSGTSPSTTEGYIGRSKFNTIATDTMYVGYKYGTSGSLDNNRLNTHDSTIKTAIDTWYKNNLNSYTSYLSTTAVYCSDREVGSGTYSASGSSFYFAGYNRLVTNYAPSYNCTNKYDAFSKSNSYAQLTYPIALMTADELKYAGGHNSDLTSPYSWYYLNSSGGSIVGSYYWWLMTPSLNKSDGVYVFFVDGSNYPGYLNNSYGIMTNNHYTRPVISIKGDLIWKSGNGTSSSPYQVETNEHVLRLTKGTGVGTTYYKLSGASSYTSTTENSITIDATNGSTYYYYGVSSTGYTMNSCTSSSPCSVTINSNIVSKSLNATLNTYSVTLSVTGGSGGGTKTVSHGGSATYTISANSGYLLTLSSNGCGGTLSGSTYKISNVTSAKSCSITLRQSLYGKILADNTGRSTRSSFSSVLTSNTTGTLYTATETNVHNTTAKTVYYYAGNTTNNWVKFGGFYWRIIRTNADGSVRMLYSGTSPSTTSAYIGTSAFNSTYNDPMYVGYMYGTSGNLTTNRTNDNSSTIKGVIDTWYSNNLKSYANYISTTAVYCNDRSVTSGTYSTSSFFYYAAYTRLYTNKSPTYNCTNSSDAFSASTSVGNGKLTYPIGLMTADEITFAGGYNFTSNASAWYYLNSGGYSITGSIWWWLLSPGYCNGNFAGVWRVLGSDDPGDLRDNPIYLAGGVRPVISISSCALWSSGNGTSSSPYQVSGGC